MDPRGRFSSGLVGCIIGRRIVPCGDGLFRRKLRRFRGGVGLMLGLFGGRRVPIFFSAIKIGLGSLGPFGDVSSSRRDTSRCCRLTRRRLRTRSDVTTCASFDQTQSLSTLEFETSGRVGRVVQRLTGSSSGVCLMGARRRFGQGDPFNVPKQRLLLRRMRPAVRKRQIVTGYFLRILQRGRSYFSGGGLRVNASRSLCGFPILRFSSLTKRCTYLRLHGKFPFCRGSLSAVAPGARMRGVTTGCMQRGG